jgi:Ca2+-binding RTX toxin-like protein
MILNLLGVDGQYVLDGGIGSNFLTGGLGADVFFLDGRGGIITWSTITDFMSGDSVNLWGWKEGVSKILFHLKTKVLQVI